MASWSRHPRRARRGFTLIELTIGVLVAGLVAGLALVSVQSLGHSQLRSSSVQIAGAIKQSYDTAIMEKRTQRIAFDLDEHQWWVEYTEDPYTLDPSQLGGERERGRGRDRDLRLDDDAPEELRQALEGGRAATFTPDPAFPARMTLPGRVHFGRTWTGMREEPFEKGTVYLHFFRGGFTEPLRLELFEGEIGSDLDSRDWVTIEVRPLTGRVKMRSERSKEKRGARPVWEEDRR